MSDQSSEEQVVDPSGTVGVDGPMPPLHDPEYVPVAEGQTNQPDGPTVEPPADDSTAENSEQSKEG